MFVDWRLAGYNLLLVLLSPYILWRKARRARSRQSPHEFDARRWNAPDLEKASNGGKRIVLLCTGMGEVLIAAELTQRLKSQVQGYEIVWAIRRQDVRDWAKAKYPEQKTTTIPFDFFWPCARWLAQLQPAMIVAVERLWWPNLLWSARRRGVKTLAVAANDFARIKHRCWEEINRWTLRGFDFIGFQSAVEEKRLSRLLSESNVAVTGVLKWFEVEKPQPDGELLQWLEHAGGPFLVAGSTHEGEEEFVLEAFAQVRQQANCILLIAPRRIQRTNGIHELCLAKGWKIARRSQSEEAPVAQPDILLLDTMGELSAVYAKASAAFVGGTLRGVGHNLMEPLMFQVPVAFGDGGKKKELPEVQKQVLEAGIGRQVHVCRELAAYWQQLLLHEDAAMQAQCFEQFRYNQLLFWQQTVNEIVKRLNVEN